MSGWWCIMPTCCSCTQNSASPSILARFSSQGYQKVLEFTGGLENAARSAVTWTESITTINPRFKVTYKCWLLLLLLGCSISWSCHGLQVHPSSRVLVCRSIHEGEYVFPNIAGCLPAWLACIDAYICSRGHVWLVVHHANLLLMHAKQCLSINTGPFLKPRVSKSTRIHWRTRKCGQISGHMDRIDHNNQSKIQGDLQMLAPAAFAWLQHVLELSWPASASIIQSGVQIHP